MAVIYLRSSDGNDADSGLTWALAKATLDAALTAAGAGGTVYVSDNHSESNANDNISPGTVASPVRVVCVDDTGNPEPPTARSTGAVFTTSNNTPFRGFTYYYGCTLDVNATQIFFLSGGDSRIVLDNCVLDTNGEFYIDRGGAEVVLLNTAVVFQATSRFLNASARQIDFVMKGGSIALTGQVPTTLFSITNGDFVRLDLIGVDLSAFGSGKNLVSVASGGMPTRFIDCKLGSSVSIVTGTITYAGVDVQVINADSADTNYRFARHTYEATETHETTIVRTGGASDGTTTFSRKIVSTANVTPHFAYESMWMEKWNESVGSALTATVEIITDNVTLTDAEIWLEVEYLGTSGFPLGSFATDRVSDPIFGTPANQTSSSETWTTTGLGTPVKQKLSVSFTPQEKGIVRARVCVAKASTTVYYDPLVTVA